MWTFSCLNNFCLYKLFGEEVKVDIDGYCSGEVVALKLFPGMCVELVPERTSDRAVPGLLARWCC